MLGKVETYARSAPPTLSKTDEIQIAQFCRMMTDMPRQTGDAVAGVIKVENMVRHLGHLPRAALNWMMGAVHARFTFHPSIKELLELASEWKRNDEAVQARAKAEIIVRKERQQRLDDARRSLRMGVFTHDAVNCLPERSKAILETEGLLMRHEDGSYTARQYHDTTTEPPADLAELRERLGGQFSSHREQAA